MNKRKYIRCICTCLVFIMCICSAPKGLATQTSGVEDPLDISITSSNTGNVFYNGEIPTLCLSVRNTGDVSDYFNFTYTVTNRYTGDSFEEARRAYILSKNIWKTVLEFDDLPYGIYDVSLSAESDSGQTSSTATASFSRVSAIYSDGERRADFGVATHLLSQLENDGKSELPVASRAGFGMIRDTIPWRSVETAKGVYSIPKLLSDFLDNCSANRLEPLMIIGLTTTGTPYASIPNYVVRDADGNPTENAEENFRKFLDNLYNYCYNLALLLKDKVTYFEIGNEYNINVTKEASDYARIMETVHTAVEKANPDAVIVAGVIAEVGGIIPTEYVEALYDNGAGQWMDCLSVHFYKANKIPGTTGYKAMEELKAVKDIIDEYADEYGDKELWVTEYGWTVPGHAPTEWIQAENLVKSQVLFAGDSIPDKSFWYRFEGTSATGYAMFSSSAVNATYVASANYNKIMTDCIYKANNSTGNKHEHLFTDTSSGKDVYVLWTKNGEENFDISIGSGSDMVISDIFGNITQPVVSNGVLSVTVGTEPVYIIPNPDEDILSLTRDNVKKVRFKGSYLTNSPVNVAVAVLKPGKTRADFIANPLTASMYLDQFATDSEGRFDELITLEGESGTYTVLYGAEGFGIEELEITWYKTPFDTELVITQEGTSVSEFKDFDPSKDFHTNIKLYNGRGLDSDCVFITAFYNGDNLVDAKTINAKAVSGESVMSFNNTEALKLPEGAVVDEIKFMMIDSFNNLVPLASAKTIR